MPLTFTTPCADCTPFKITYQCTDDCCGIVSPRLIPLLLAVICTVVGYCSLATAQTQTDLRIESQPLFTHAQVVFLDNGMMRLSGKLVDDAGASLRRVAFEANWVAARRRVKLNPCTTPLARGAPSTSSLLHWRTDDRGEYCLTARAPSAGSQQKPPSIELRFAGDEYRKAATTVVPIVPSPLPASIGFEGPTVELDLGAEQHIISLTVHVPETALSAPPEIPYVALALVTSDGNMPLGTVPAPGGVSKVPIVLSSASLGAPGTGRLTAEVHLAGNVLATDQAVMMRTAHVQLKASSVRWSREDVSLRIRAVTVSGHVPQGRVQVRVGPEIVAESVLNQGVAALQVARSSDSPFDLLTIHFAASSPWWRAGKPLRLSLQPTVQPTVQWPWLLVLAAVVLTLLPRRSRRRILVSETALPASNQPANRSKPGSLERPVVDCDGWTGRIVDAHDGQPVAGAVLQVVVPSFRDPPTVLEATSTADGYFSFSASGFEIPDGTEISAQAAHHSSIRQELPRFGHFQLTMFSRRRTLLKNLLRWGQQHRPAAAGPRGEPTPTQILRSVREPSRSEAAAWAQRMRDRIYGAAPVNAEVEATLLAAEPTIVSRRPGPPVRAPEVDDPTSRNR